MAGTLASASDLATLLGIPVPEADSVDALRMNLILELASGWAREFARRTWDADVPETVRGIVLASARREWVNPRRIGYEVKGPESASYIQSAYPAGFFTDAEERRLRAYRSTGGLHTVSTYRDTEEESVGYLAIDGVGGWLPMYHPNDPGWDSAFKL